MKLNNKKRYARERHAKTDAVIIAEIYRRMNITL
jgi:hypothetical protein